MFKKLFQTQKSSCCDVKITEVNENESAATTEAKDTCCTPKEETTQKSCCN